MPQSTHRVHDDVAALVDEPLVPFASLTASDIEPTLRPPQWIVQDLLERATVTTLVAKPASFKSFLSLHLAACIATGTPFFGRKVEQAPVFYICTEGVEGFKRRVVAWEQHHGKSLDQLVVIPSTMSLQDDAQMDRLVDTITAYAETHDRQRPGLVVLDTLSKVALGVEENSNEAMSQLMANIQRRLVDRMRIGVWIVHHTAKGQDHARGASALEGAVDNEFRLARQPLQNGDHMLTMKAHKTKDGDDTRRTVKAVTQLHPLFDLIDNYGSQVTTLTLREPTDDDNVALDQESNELKTTPIQDRLIQATRAYRDGDFKAHLQTRTESNNLSRDVKALTDKIVKHFELDATELPSDRYDLLKHLVAEMTETATIKEATSNDDF